MAKGQLRTHLKNITSESSSIENCTRKATENKAVIEKHYSELATLSYNLGTKTTMQRLCDYMNKLPAGKKLSAADFKINGKEAPGGFIKTARRGKGAPYGVKVSTALKGIETNQQADLNAQPLSLKPGQKIEDLFHSDDGQITCNSY